ncbi:MAG TPA: phosphoribosyltransferase family protein [Thermomicrobiaceae bacterium]|nr:phosphoribosyltransferase family protein [Thermomicrobiaceae bacterium]
MKRFRDRRAAGVQLARLLAGHRFVRPVVLGIPRGGVLVSIEVARALGADHGVVVARKLGAPGQSELAIGAVTADGSAFVDRALATLTGADEHYLAAEQARQIAEARRREDYLDGRRRPSLRGRDVIVVDDGVATGATAIAALRSVRAQGAARVVFTVPVGPSHTLAALREEADEVICLWEEPEFFAVGQFYQDFEPVEDGEVRAILEAGAAHTRHAELRSSGDG